MKSHGNAKARRITPELRAWYQMKGRCYDEAVPKYKNYGARGIKVCDRWRNSFENFLADIGARPTPKHSLDRIENDGDYEPGNCRWATQKTQQRNRRDNRIVLFAGHRMSLAEASEKSGLRYGLLKRRLQLGWPESEIFQPNRRAA